MDTRSPSTCVVHGCDRSGEHLDFTLCSVHYSRLRLHGDVLADKPVLDGTQGCTVNGCDRDHHAHGWCSAHYNRWRREGDPQPDKPVRPMRARGRTTTVSQTPASRAVPDDLTASQLRQARIQPGSLNAR